MTARLNRRERRHGAPAWRLAELEHLERTEEFVASLDALVVKNSDMGPLVERLRCRLARAETFKEHDEALKAFCVDLDALEKHYEQQEVDR